jgi:hypothetical protein
MKDDFCEILTNYSYAIYKTLQYFCTFYSFQKSSDSRAQQQTARALKSRYSQWTFPLLTTSRLSVGSDLVPNVMQWRAARSFPEGLRGKGSGGAGLAIYFNLVKRLTTLGPPFRHPSLLPMQP